MMLLDNQINNSLEETSDQVDEIAKSSYLNYSIYALKRAIADAKDGLKPVQRRILFAMYENKIFFSGNSVKSIKVVGEVLGKFHPHGDNSVYDAMVKMAQDFSLRYPLIAPQGNFGSIDGDNAAASRYTEVKLSNISSGLLNALEKKSAVLVDNFDGTRQEPICLPAELPFLLLNGTYGIAVGVMSAIPPHNLSEIVTALIMLLRNENITTADILSVVHGPDFPTGGILSSTGMYDIYDKGFGTLYCCGRAKWENGSAIIYEIPFGIKKSTLLAEIAENRKTLFSEIKEIRDETSMEGIRVVLEPYKGFTEKEFNNLMLKIRKHTSFQKALFFNFLVLNGEILESANIKRLLTIFLDHKRSIVKSRLKYDIASLLDREENLKILYWCQHNLDFLFDTLKSSTNQEVICQALLKGGLLKHQIEKVLATRISSLTRTEAEKTAKDLKLAQDEKERLQEILSSEILISNLIESELLDSVKKYGDKRLTTITNVPMSIASHNIDDDNAYVIVLGNRYIVKVEADFFRERGVRTKGTELIKSLGNISNVFSSSEKSNLILFTNQGRIYKIDVSTLVNISNAEHNILNVKDVKELFVDKNEYIADGFSYKVDEELPEFLSLFSKFGNISKFNLARALRCRNGTKIMVLKDDDEIMRANVATDNSEVVCVSKMGMANCFPIAEVRSTGIGSQGVKALRLRKGDSLAACTVEKEEFIFVFSVGGMAKSASKEALRRGHRATVGIRIMKLENDDNIVSAFCSIAESSFLIFSNNRIVVSKLEHIPVHKGRNTIGRKIFDEQISRAIKLI